jgi:hypothetical protein
LIHTVLTLAAGIAPGYIAGRFVGHHGLVVGFAVGFVGYVLFAIPDFVRVWSQWDWPVYAQFLWSGAENPGVLSTLSGGLGEAHNRARRRYAL